MYMFSIIIKNLLIVSYGFLSLSHLLVVNSFPPNSDLISNSPYCLPYNSFDVMSIK